jgi:hypothetical protein
MDTTTHKMDTKTAALPAVEVETHRQDNTNRRHSDRRTDNRREFTMSNIKMCNDFGEVEITEELIEAIDLIQDAAATLELTPAEFITTFDYGMPTCPCCEAGDKTEVKSH